MHFVVVVVSLVLISCALPEVCEVRGQGQVKAPEVSKPEIVKDGNRKSVGPVVETFEPKMGSVDSVIYLSGLRLYRGESIKTKAFVTYYVCTGFGALIWKIYLLQRVL